MNRRDPVALPPRTLAYHEAVPTAAIATDYPPPPRHVEVLGAMSTDERESRNLDRLKTVLNRASKLEFYQRLWATHGFEPGDVRELRDLSTVPHFSVNDLRASIEANPPFGQHQSPANPDAAPYRVLFSGGTTGQPRPVLHSARDREIGELIQARHLWAAGVGATDIVMNSFGYGPHNAAATMHEGAYRWLGSMVLPVSTGNVTSSRIQVTMAHQYQATAWLGMSDYLVHLAGVARDLGLDPEKDFKLRTIVCGGDPALASVAWGGVPAFGLYGTYELQTPGGECQARTGIHYSDDAHVVHVHDEETGALLPDGQRGQLLFTSLYNEAFPIVRFNTLDRSAHLPDEPCACGQPNRRIAGFLGRSDTMVKLRGLNIYPEDVGRIATEHPRSNGEYICVLSRRDNVDTMTLMVELASPAPEDDVKLATELRSRLGVKVAVQVVSSGGLAELTGLGVRTKPVRFRDDRNESG